MNIKLGQLLHKCEINEIQTKQGYRPRLVKSTWVVCKIGDTKGSKTVIKVCNGKDIETINHFESSIFTPRAGEFYRGWYKTELAAVKSLLQTKCPFKDEPEWVLEWEADQRLLKNAIAKLRA